MGGSEIGGEEGCYGRGHCSCSRCDPPKAKARNHGMIQLTYREIEEEEPLRTYEVFGITLWLDATSNVVLIDVPPGYTSHVVGSEPESLDIL
jgi:hypothetical protein